MSKVTVSAGEENKFTDWIQPMVQLAHGVTGAGFLDLSISGTWEGTVTLQKKHGVDGTTHEVETYTANAVALIEDHSPTVYYRAGIATGGYTSGTAVVLLEQ